MELSARRPYLTAGVALTTATAIAFAPVIAPTPAPSFDLPRVSMSEVHLAALINPADVTALVANLNAAMAGVGATVTTLVANADQTLTGALNSAVAVNDNVWDGLIDAARGSAVLVTLLRGLRAASSGGLSDLSAAVGSAGDAVTLTTGELTSLLTSTVTGSLATALQAVVRTVNDPLALSSYIALAAAPLGIAGLALGSGIDAVRSLATNGVDLVDTVVHGVTAQVGNALTLVNSLLAAGRDLTDSNIVDGVLTAVQGIVSAPVTAVLAGVNGVTSTLADGATFTVDKLADGAGSLVRTWLGSGTDAGALQNAVSAIGAAPLSPAAYTKAISILVGAGINSVQTVVGTASKFVSVPFRVGAGLTNATADVITELTSGLATAASGVLQAVGMPSFVYGLPHVVATAVNLAVQVAAKTTAAALNTIAGVLDVGTSIGSRVSLPSSVATANTARTALSSAVSTHAALVEAPNTVTVDVAPAAAGGDGAHDSGAVPSESTTAQSADSATQPPPGTLAEAQAAPGAAVEPAEPVKGEAEQSAAGVPTVSPAAVQAPVSTGDSAATETAQATEPQGLTTAPETATNRGTGPITASAGTTAQSVGAAAKPPAGDEESSAPKPKHAAVEQPRAGSRAEGANYKPRHAAPEGVSASPGAASPSTPASGAKPRHAAPERGGAATSEKGSGAASSPGSTAESAKHASSAVS